MAEWVTNAMVSIMIFLLAGDYGTPGNAVYIVKCVD